MPRLRLHSPAFIQGLGSTLEFAGAELTIGRGPDNDIVIPECTVAPQHARLQHTPAGWLLTDLPNTNGIWIGIRRVPAHLLAPAQLFRIGSVALEFIDDGGESTLVVDPHPDRTETAAAQPSRDSSGVHEPVMQSGPTEVNPPDWQLPSDPAALTSEPEAAAPPRRATQRLMVALLVLTVVGFVFTIGATVAWRWLTRAYSASPRKLPKFASTAATVTSGAPAASKPQPLTLVNQAVDVIGTEQAFEVPSVLNLRLPADALHKPTHVVIARTPNSGWTFCGTTRFAEAAYEIATAANAVWLHPATLELAVNVNQLAKTQVPALAIGFRDAADEQWSLLPTEYDATRRTARAKLQQPGVVALFFVKGPEYYASSEHFSLLFEPPQDGQGTSPAPQHPEAALNQLEADLAAYRKQGYRIPGGMLWACAARSNPAKAAALLPVFPRRELEKQHSVGLARAAFAALIPGYVGPHSMVGREFWFAAMLESIAADATGVRATSTPPSFRRLSSSLIADDWPWSPLFVNLIPRLLDKQANLFRLWNDTTHVIVELDAKSDPGAQSPALAIDLSLQTIANRSLLDLHFSYVIDRLLAEHGLALEVLRNHEVCSHATQLAAESRNANVTLEVPKALTARFACVAIDVKSGTTRSIHLRLTNDVPAGMSYRLLRLSSGQIVEPSVTSAQATRFDLTASEIFVLTAANPSLSQTESVSLRVEDVSIATSIVPSEVATVRVNQPVVSALNLLGIPDELKTLSIEWDFGDGTPKARSEWTPNAKRSLRIDQSHAWTREGTYILRASVFESQDATREMSFASRNIVVQALKLELVTGGTHFQVGTEVRLHARLSGPAPDSVAYRFTFGDASSPTTTSSPDATHQFGTAGEYEITVEALASAASTEVLASGKTLLSIRSAEAPAASGNLTPQPATPAAATVSPQQAGP